MGMRAYFCQKSPHVGGKFEFKKGPGRSKKCFLPNVFQSMAIFDSVC